MPSYNYVAEYVSPDVAVAVARLLMPAFIEFEGGVFLKDYFSVDTFREWQHKLESISAVENMINHRHVYDMFTMNDISEESYIVVARLIEVSFRICLKHCFPDREFIVEYSNSDDDYGPIVTFYSKL